MDKVLAWLDGHFINGWRRSLKDLSSVQFGAFGGAAALVWSHIEDDKRAAILALLHVDQKWLVPIGCAVAIYLRLKRKDDQ